MRINQLADKYRDLPNQYKSASTISGSGASGKVVVDPLDSNYVIKRQKIGENIGLDMRDLNSVDDQTDMQVELGRLKAMPEVDSTETEDGYHYTRMKNLSESGYITEQAFDERYYSPEEVAALKVEKHLMNQQLTKSGIESADLNKGNIMVLPPHLWSEYPTRPRTMFIDPGYYSHMEKDDKWGNVSRQRGIVVDAYSSIGESDRGNFFDDLVWERLHEDDIEGAQHIINDAVSDLSNRYDAFKNVTYNIDHE